MSASTAAAGFDAAALGLRFHHLGVATRRIAREEPVWRSLGYVQEGARFADPIQGVAGIFLTGPGPRLELLEQLPGSTVLDGWLDRGVKIYHQAFEVAGLDAAIGRITGLGAKVTVAPVPAVAFGGRRISFLMLPTLALIELIDSEVAP